MSQPDHQAQTGGAVPLGTLVRADGDDPRDMGWLRTVWHLACEPTRHPWQQGRGRKGWWGPTVVACAVAVIVAMLLLQGCALWPWTRKESDPTPKPPRRSTDPVARVQLGPPGRALCQTLAAVFPLSPDPDADPARWMIEVQLPAALGEADVVLHPVAPANLAGARARLLGQLEPAQPQPLSEPMRLVPFPARLTPRRLRVELLPPEGEQGAWLSKACAAGCRLRVEVQAPFGAGPMLADFLHAAATDLEQLEVALLEQRPNPLPGSDAAGLATGFEAALSGGSCRSPGFVELLQGIGPLIEALRGVHAAMYGASRPGPFEGQPLVDGWKRAAELVDGVAANLEGVQPWPAWDALPALAAHVVGMRELRSALPAAEHEHGAYWLALSLVTHRAAFERLRTVAPALQSLKEARQRRAFVLGLVHKRPKWLTVPGTRWLVPVHRSQRFPGDLLAERLCFGPDGLLPVPPGSKQRQRLEGWLAAQGGGDLVIRTPADVTPVLRRLTDSRELLCAAPRVDVRPLRAHLREQRGSLADLSAALQQVVMGLDYRDSTAAGHPLGAQMAELAEEALCASLAAKRLQRKLRTVNDYASFVHGGAHVLRYAPRLPLRCGKQTLSAAELRKRLRKLWAKVIRRASTPLRLRDEIRAGFGLQAPHFARPVRSPDSVDLDDPPASTLSHRGCGQDAWSRGLDDPDLRREAQQATGEIDLPKLGSAPRPTINPTEVPVPAAGTTGLRLRCFKGRTASVSFRIPGGAGPLLYLRSPASYRLAGRSATRRSDDVNWSAAWVATYDLRRHRGTTVELVVQPTSNNQPFLVTTVAASAR